MKERGMIFNGEMVRAILDGRKTQTRRIMTVQSESSEFGLRYIAESSLAKEVGMYFWSQSDACGMKARSKPFACPYGKPGDRIWVREAFRVHSRATDVATLVYKASERNSWTEQTHRVPVAFCNKPATPEKWTPSLHMPRWASRILLEITDVRVERLNAISQEDAQAEGMELTGWRPTYSDPDSGGKVMTPYDNFAELWSSIYGDESWKANPWVWVISFKRVEGGAA
ncbi:TPA: hypothetical protein L9L67_003435 [Klebsiella quasipneumoniae subsp. quasipneumoniae]|uniref:hypothetical protein n=1 Tax=Klebsiella quasipneumoniae TaxID=1463165 RepID=UPI0021A63305|nr:hypothetical protein [Klebsiella quasipneumoniae]HBR1513908.1 hypothetical protein [Klebsiella quasipneumoniae subsp. quasipneumoniae]HBR1955342.1 hypothetical protein [Klebsiella quasipneumoniae subsp. quasipneumoniae]